MAFIQTVPRSRAEGETAAAYAELARVMGSNIAPHIIEVFSLRPATLRAVIRNWELTQWVGSAPRSETEFLGAVVSRLNSCAYCTDVHEAFLRAAGSRTERAMEVLSGSTHNVTPLETSLVALARTAQQNPRSLSTDSLSPLRSLVGDDALQYAQVLGMFHLINRVADLLGVQLEFPRRLRNIEWLRRRVLQVLARMFQKMNIAPREVELRADEALDRACAALERLNSAPSRNELERLRARPALLELIALNIEELLERNSMGRPMLARIHARVEAALPQDEADLSPLQPLPSDPIDAFIVAGTRYPYRSTPSMIDALRGMGYDDLGILDLGLAIASANQWVRQFRVLGIPQLVSPRWDG